VDKNRVFTDEELKEMGIRTLDLIFEAIDANDKGKAKELCNRMYQECQFLHDAYMFWVSGLLTHIYRRYGVDALEQAEREAHGIEAKAVFKPPEKTDVRSKVEGLVQGLRGHLQPITIEEDDEKVCLTMNPCGSGQRIFEKGGYEPPINLATIEEPHAITWGRTHFPVYCVHSPVLGILAIENTGYPAAVIFPPEKVGTEPCRFCVYKDPDAIPEEAYTKLGKKKPSR
jgi:hypothetical protein